MAPASSLGTRPAQLGAGAGPSTYPSPKAPRIPRLPVRRAADPGRTTPPLPQSRSERDPVRTKVSAAVEKPSPRS